MTEHYRDVWERRNAPLAILDAIADPDLLLATLDPDDPDHGQKVAEVRAEEVRLRRFRE